MSKVPETPTRRHIEKNVRGDLYHYLNFTTENKGEEYHHSGKSTVIKSVKDELQRKSSVISSQPIPSKKKSVNGKYVINAENIRRNCVRDFPKTWNESDKFGGISERTGTINLLEEEPIRFWNKDIEHEDFNERCKTHEWYERIKEGNREKP